MNKDQEGLQSLEQPLKSDWVDLVRSAIPDILVHILPLFAAKKLAELANQKDTCASDVDADACYEFLKEITTQEVSKRSRNGKMFCFTYDFASVFPVTSSSESINI